jgi:hypothetical protein
VTPCIRRVGITRERLRRGREEEHWESGVYRMIIKYEKQETVKRRKQTLRGEEPEAAATR